MKTCPSCQRTFDDNLRFCQNDGTELIADDPFKTMIAGQPLAPENDPLEIPAFDPNKTSVFSAQEQQDVLSTPDPFAGLPQPEPEPFMPPPPPADTYSPPSYEPEPQPIPPPPPAPSFSEPEQVYQPQPSPFDSPFSPPQQQNAGAGDWQAPPAPMQQWGDQGAGFGSNTPFQPPGAVAGQSKGLAITSMVLGILSIVCCWLGILLGPAGAITGWIAKNKADQDPMNYGGRGMAMAGLITGIIGTVIAILYIALNILGVALGGFR